MKDNTLLYVGGAGLALYLFTRPKTPTTLPLPGSATVPGAPAPPTTYNDAYYLTYQYPAMVAANPNVSNPNYQLTPAEAQQYKQNYLELQQWLPTVLKNFNNSELQALQYHWKNYGVAQKYSFMPFTPPKNANWVPPPPSAKSSGSSSTFSTILSTAATVAVALIGNPPPGNYETRLNDADLWLLFNGCAIAKHIVPMYAGVEPELSVRINNKMDEILSQYA